MANGRSEWAASLRKQDAATFSLPSACPSFRIYYYDGAVGSVPFEWESHPGTPKHPSSNLHLPLPPTLTPPPSHFSFSEDQFRRRRPKNPSKKILSLIPTRLFWLKKVQGASSRSVSERVLMNDNEYDLFKFQTKRKAVVRRFSSFDSSLEYPNNIPTSHSTSCFGFRTCFIS